MGRERERLGNKVRDGLKERGPKSKYDSNRKPVRKCYNENSFIYTNY